MPNLTSQQLYQNVEKALTAQAFAPLYFFHGDEPYLINQAVQYLKVCALHEGAADFNFISFYAADVEVSRVRDEVETLPMMASRRVVILREVQDLTDKEWEQLAPVLTAPVESTVFILVGSRVDKRKKFFKIVSETAVMTEFRKPFENQIPGWIRQICKVHNLGIQDEALQLLHRLVGNNLNDIEAEVKKLADFLGGRHEVSFEDVASCVSNRREENVFALAAKIAEGDRVEALLQLANLLENGQNEVGIVAMVSRHIRLLLQLLHGQQSGLAGQKLSTFAQVPNYFLSEYLAQSRLWTVRKLEQALIVMADTDKALKSSPLSSHLWLENMIMKTCMLTSANTQLRSNHYDRAET